MIVVFPDHTHLLFLLYIEKWTFRFNCEANTYLIHHCFLIFHFDSIAKNFNFIGIFEIRVSISVVVWLSSISNEKNQKSIANLCRHVCRFTPAQNKGTYFVLSNKYLHLNPLLDYLFRPLKIISRKIVV